MCKGCNRILEACWSSYSWQLWLLPWYGRTCTSRHIGMSIRSRRTRPLWCLCRGTFVITKRSVRGTREALRRSYSQPSLCKFELMSCECVVGNGDCIVCLVVYIPFQACVIFALRAKIRRLAGSRLNVKVTRRLISLYASERFSRPDSRFIHTHTI